MLYFQDQNKIFYILKIPFRIITLKIHKVGYLSKKGINEDAISIFLIYQVSKKGLGDCTKQKNLDINSINLNYFKIRVVNFINTLFDELK